jgi:hypothetical protein
MHFFHETGTSNEWREWQIKTRLTYKAS